MPSTDPKTRGTGITAAAGALICRQRLLIDRKTGAAATRAGVLRTSQALLLIISHHEDDSGRDDASLSRYGLDVASEFCLVMGIGLSHPRRSRMGNGTAT